MDSAYIYIKLEIGESSDELVAYNWSTMSALLFPYPFFCTILTPIEIGGGDCFSKKYSHQFLS
jgi:hypothetical protein